MEKKKLLGLIVEQLQTYELNAIAQQLIDIVAEDDAVPPIFTPSNRLHDLVAEALKSEEDLKEQQQQADEEESSAKAADDASKMSKEDVNDQPDVASISSAPFNMSSEELTAMYGPCLDKVSKTHRPAQRLDYRILFTTMHKMPVATVAFSWDGNYLATGSEDTSLKVLDVEKMRLRNAVGGEVDDFRPTIRTLYDHTERVNEVSFHPGTRVLASCSDDRTIKLFDLQRVTNKKSFKQLNDSSPIRSISFHPTGDYLLSGTADGPVRLYDVRQGQCFSSQNDSDNHQSGINYVRWSADGRMYVTAGDDGNIKIWDSQSGKLINTIQAAHGGHQVASVCFSKTGRYLLSAGTDSCPKIWDMTSFNRPVLVVHGAQQREKLIQACFSYNEDLIISGCEKTNGIVLWCSRTGTLIDRYAGHSNPAHAFSASPVDPGFASCSDDNKARYWNIPQ